MVGVAISPLCRTRGPLQLKCLQAVYIPKYLLEVEQVFRWIPQLIGCTGAHSNYQNFTCNSLITPQKAALWIEPEVCMHQNCSLSLTSTIKYIHVWKRNTWETSPCSVMSVALKSSNIWTEEPVKRKAIEIHKEHDIVLWKSSLVLVTTIMLSAVTCNLCYHNHLWKYILYIVSFGDFSIMCFAFWWQWFLPS